MPQVPGVQELAASARPGGPARPPHERDEGRCARLVRGAAGRPLRHVRADRGRAGRPSLSDRPAGRFVRKPWSRPTETGEEGGGGVISVMQGRVFEKVGVNVSTVWGEFSPEFRASIPAPSRTRASGRPGISVVAHPQSPRVPAAHMNTRMLVTTRGWFGGGGDLTPMRLDSPEAQDGRGTFHARLPRRAATGTTRSTTTSTRHGATATSSCRTATSRAGRRHLLRPPVQRRRWRRTSRSRRTSGRAFRDGYSAIVRRRMGDALDPAERDHQLLRRGRYVEFNLLHDRGTLFGLKTRRQRGGDPDEPAAGGALVVTLAYAAARSGTHACQPGRLAPC